MKGLDKYGPSPSNVKFREVLLPALSAALQSPIDPDTIQFLRVCTVCGLGGAEAGYRDVFIQLSKASLLPTAD